MAIAGEFAALIVRIQGRAYSLNVFFVDASAPGVTVLASSGRNAGLAAPFVNRVGRTCVLIQGGPTWGSPQVTAAPVIELEDEKCATDSLCYGLCFAR